MKRAAPYLAGASALAAALWAPGLWAQVAEADGGARFVGQLDMSLEIDDGETTYRTGFDIDLISATRTQRLSFSTDVGLELDLSNFETDWADPSYQLEYLRDNGQSRITALIGYASREVDGSILDLSTAFDETDLIEDDGTRESRQLNLGFEWGMQDPFGGNLSYTYSDTIYTDTSDPDLFDRTSETLSGSLRFDIDRTLSVTLDASAQLTQEEDLTQSETETLRAGVGVNWQLRPDIALNGRVGLSRVEQDQLLFGIFPSNTVREGGEASLSATFDRPNGNYGLSWSTGLNTLGRQSTIELSRSLELPNGRSLSGSIGQTFLPTGPDFTIGSLSYSQETQRGQIEVSASRAASVSALDAEVVRTQLTAGYSGELNNNASWSITGTWLDSDFVNPINPDIRSSNLSLRYNMMLTSDWDLATGISLRETREDGSAANDRATLFLTLERTFVVRR